MKGFYRMKEDGRLRCGGASIGYEKGCLVEVKQVDERGHKVLIDFGDRVIDWFDNSILRQMEKETAGDLRG